ELADPAAALTTALVLSFWEVERHRGEQLGLVETLREDPLSLPVPGVRDQDAAGARVDRHVVDVAVTVQLSLGRSHGPGGAQFRLETEPRSPGHGALDLAKRLDSLPGGRTGNLRASAFGACCCGAHRDAPPCLTASAWPFASPWG